MRALLDINVLLALLDSDHVEHDRAIGWLDGGIAAGWASCALTENGLVRILSQPRYPSPVSPATAIDLLRDAREGGDHEFWPCDLSVLDEQVFDGSRLHGPRQVTDAYLLALAVEHGGRFVTFDRTVSVEAVRQASQMHLVIL